MKLLATLIGFSMVALAAGANAEAESVFLFQGESRLDAGSNQGSAALALPLTTLVRGKPFDLELSFRTTSGGTFYNVWLSPSLPLPATLAIYDSQKKYLGDLLVVDESARATVRPADWLFIPADRSVGIHVSRRAGYVAQTSYGVIGHLLPPGTYYLQLIFLRALASETPLGDRALQTFYKSLDRTEYFRSNVVEIRLRD